MKNKDQILLEKAYSRVNENKQDLVSRGERLNALKGMSETNKKIEEINNKYQRLKAGTYERSNNSLHSGFEIKNLPPELNEVKEKYSNTHGTDDLYIELEWWPDTLGYSEYGETWESIEGSWRLTDSNGNEEHEDIIWSSQNPVIHEKINELLIDTIVNQYMNNWNNRRTLEDYFSSY
jgi:hypothetical protein